MSLPTEGKVDHAKEPEDDTRGRVSIERGSILLTGFDEGMVGLDQSLQFDVSKLSDRQTFHKFMAELNRMSTPDKQVNAIGGIFSKEKVATQEASMWRKRFVVGMAVSVGMVAVLFGVTLAAVNAAKDAHVENGALLDGNGATIKTASSDMQITSSGGLHTRSGDGEGELVKVGLRPAPSYVLEVNETARRLAATQGPRELQAGPDFGRRLMDLQATCEQASMKRRLDDGRMLQTNKAGIRSFSGITRSSTAALTNNAGVGAGVQISASAGAVNSAAGSGGCGRALADSDDVFLVDLTVTKAGERKANDAGRYVQAKFDDIDLSLYVAGGDACDDDGCFAFMYQSDADTDKACRDFFRAASAEQLRDFAGQLERQQEGDGRRTAQTGTSAADAFFDILLGGGGDCIHMSSGGSTCFPGRAMVQSGAQRTAMRDLGLGATIETTRDFEQVHDEAWLGDYHRSAKQAEVYAEFVALTHERSAEPFLITGEHFMYIVDGASYRMLPARDVVVGDRLFFYDREKLEMVHSTVLSIGSVMEYGIFAPITWSGRLIVDGVVVNAHAITSESFESLYAEFPQLPYEQLIAAFDPFPYYFALGLGQASGYFPTVDAFMDLLDVVVVKPINLLARAGSSLLKRTGTELKCEARVEAGACDTSETQK